MHKHPTSKDALTAFSVVAIALMFVVQGTIMVSPKPLPRFSIAFRNIAFGYHTGTNLCIGHSPNGATSGSEQCDDGNASNLDACLNTCKNAACGDGYVRSGSEGCDDGNTSAGDGCSATCTVESGWSCSGTAPSSCSQVCGNGVKTSSEGCDDGDTTSGDGCSATCTVESGWSCSGTAPSSCVEVCGNSIKTSGEGCDDGDTSSGDGCSATCTVESGWSCSGSTPTTCSEVCGNGVVTATEGCDDGNTSNGDGCNSSCDEESGWNCTGAPSDCETDCGDGIIAGAETCDDGNATDTDACRNTCVAASCGDGVIEAGVETCDDAGESATCDSNCTAVTCGDQTTNTTAGEQCDDGNSANTDACVACQSAFCGDGHIRNGAELCEPPGVGTCTAFCTTQTGIGGGSNNASSSSSAISRNRPPVFCGNGVVEPEKGEKCDEGEWKNRTSPTCDPWCGTLRCGDGWVHPESEECEPEKAKDGSYVVRTCGERSCTVPQCDDEGNCIGGCRWVFLPLCKNTPLEQPSASAASQQSNGNAPLQTSASPVSTSSAASFSGPRLEIPSSMSSSGIRPIPSSSAASINTASVCGNARVEGSEECDEGNQNSDTRSNTCRTSCRYAYCGDNVVDNGEQCDDGNDVAGDGCTPECSIAVCGNGFLEVGEECDGGIFNSDTEPDRCSTLCIMPRCGDGMKDPGFGEECDFGEMNSNTQPDTCRLDCSAPHCGDGVVDAGEQCDDGNTVHNDGCSNTCYGSFCGNSVIEPGEVCDDGNRDMGDGCDSSCIPEPTTFLDWLRKQLFAPFRALTFKK